MSPTPDSKPPINPPPPKHPPRTDPPPDNRPPTKPPRRSELGTGSPWPSRPQGPSGPGGPTGPGRLTHPTPDPVPPPPPPTPAHPLAAIRILLSEALKLAESEIARSDQLVTRVAEVCESERTRARIRLAMAAVERWAAAADVDFPLGSGRASGLAVSAAPVGAVGGSGRGAQLPAAGVDVPAIDDGRDGGRAGGAVGAATFSLPAIPTVPSFDNGPPPGRCAQGWPTPSRQIGGA